MNVHFRNQLEKSCRQHFSREYIQGVDWQEQLSILLTQIQTYNTFIAAVNKQIIERALIVQYTQYQNVVLTGSDVVTDVFTLLPPAE